LHQEPHQLAYQAYTKNPHTRNSRLVAETTRGRNKHLPASGSKDICMAPVTTGPGLEPGQASSRVIQTVQSSERIATRPIEVRAINTITQRKAIIGDGRQVEPKADTQSKLHRRQSKFGNAKKSSQARQNCTVVAERGRGRPRPFDHATLTK